MKIVIVGKPSPCKRNKTSQDVLLLENNKVQGYNGHIAASHHAVVDHFPRTAQHGARSRSRSVRVLRERRKGDE